MTSPAPSLKGVLIVPIFQVGTLRLSSFSDLPELPGLERGGTKTQIFLQREKPKEEGVSLL